MTATQRKWGTFERIQAMLRDNYAAYDRNKTRGIDGGAQVQEALYDHGASPRCCGRWLTAPAYEETLPLRYSLDLAQWVNKESSTVLAAFYGEDGRTLQRTFTLAGHSRLNIDVTLSVPELARPARGGPAVYQ